MRSDDVGRQFVYSKPRRSPTPPDPDTRKAYTETLSTRGARAIQGAALKSVQLGRPFRAMWVFSVSDAYLADFRPTEDAEEGGKPLLTLSGEFRRLWHWVTDYCRLNGHPRPFYAYACESKSDGDRDYHPHLHLLTSLVLRKSEFESFAPKLEAAWGLGSVHMEVIRQGRSAAKYLLKGVRYSVKGASCDEGAVWGRRWSVSKEVRAIEQRESVSLDAGDTLFFEGVMETMRNLGVARIQTDWGSVTPRGFYPIEGGDPAHWWLAAGAANAQLSQMGSPEVLPPF